MRDLKAAIVLLILFVCAADVGRAQTAKAGGISTLTPGQLTVCTYGGFAPVCYKESGKLVGFDVSFLTRFAESLGLKIVTREEAFDGIWTLPGLNQCDVAGAGVMQRVDRKVTPGGSWSEPYFHVNRSLLVRSGDQTAFNDYRTLRGKRIVVTRGSTADLDARVNKPARYPNCTIQFVDQVVPKDQTGDAQGFIVRELIAKNKADAFGEGDVSNDYLRDRYGKDVHGGLAVADVHPIAGPLETFNFITRDASLGVRDRLNAFIARNKDCYTQEKNCPAPVK